MAGHPDARQVRLDPDVVTLVEARQAVWGGSLSRTVNRLLREPPTPPQPPERSEQRQAPESGAEPAPAARSAPPTAGPGLVPPRPQAVTGRLSKPAFRLRPGR